MDTFVIAHTRTGRQETVTDAQFEKIKKTFPGMFKKVDNPKADISKFSDKAKTIITDSEIPVGKKKESEKVVDDMKEFAGDNE